MKDYWSELDSKLEGLATEGAVELPSLVGFDLEGVAENIAAEMGRANFKEFCSSHQMFLDRLGVSL